MSSMILYLVLLVMILGVVKKVRCADAMITGAKEGLGTAAGILPSLVCMMTAVGCLRASGLMDQMLSVFAPALSWLPLPREALPLLLVRPLSGSASMAMVKELMDVYGPDSPQAVAGCILSASGETLFYVLAVYTGASGVRKTRHAVPAGLFAWLCGALAAAFVWPMAM